MAGRHSIPAVSYNSTWQDCEEEIPTFLRCAQKSIELSDHVLPVPHSWQTHRELPPRPVPLHMMSLVPQPYLGWGVRSMLHIPKDRTVALYGGLLLSDDFDVKSRYVVSMEIDGKRYFLDGNKGPRTLGIYVNHSCDPNCAMTWYVYKGTVMMVIISLRRIEPLEYLSVDYGPTYEINGPCCHCGAANCPDLEAFREYRRTTIPTINSGWGPSL